MQGIESFIALMNLFTFFCVLPLFNLKIFYCPFSCSPSFFSSVKCNYLLYHKKIMDVEYLAFIFSDTHFPKVAVYLAINLNIILLSTLILFHNFHDLFILYCFHELFPVLNIFHSFFTAPSFLGSKTSLF